jgi:hypothetical protein
MVQGLGHEIVRALETHPKSVPWKIKICVVTSFQVQCKKYPTGLSTKCFSITMLFMCPKCSSFDAYFALEMEECRFKTL